MKKLILILSLCVLFACDKENSTEPQPETPQSLALHTEGRWFINENNEKVLLRGVNIPSLEWNAKGENMLQSFEYMVDEWGCNLLRIPLSQDRWFGYGEEWDQGNDRDGSYYRSIVQALVNMANEKGVYIWLELHWSNGNVWGENIGQHKMPDENSIVFWEDVAGIYKNNPAVLFGVYNEPHGIDFDFWYNGGEYTEHYDRNGEDVELTYRAVGMQELVDVIRATGADNIILVSGIDWGYDLSGVLDGYAIQGENIAYDTHCYPWKDTNWNAKYGDVGQQYPIIIGEWGLNKEEAGHQQYGIRIRDYLRQHQFCWTAWCLHPSAGPSLIKDWNYTPTWFGELVMMELQHEIVIE